MALLSSVLIHGIPGEEESAVPLSTHGRGIPGRRDQNGAMVQPSRSGPSSGRGVSARGPLAAGVVVLVGLVAWALGGAGDSTSDPELPTTQSSMDVAPAPDETIPDLPLLELIITTEAFWSAIGSGDTEAVLELLDPEASAALEHHASFVTAFEAGFTASNCAPIAPDTIRCALEATNPDLVSVYYRRAGDETYETTASVTFNERGITHLDLPGIVGSASIRLLQTARAADAFPEACDRGHYPPEDLPRFSASLAQTGACGEALAAFLPLAAEGG